MTFSTKLDVHVPSGDIIFIAGVRQHDAVMAVDLTYVYEAGKKYWRIFIGLYGSRQQVDGSCGHGEASITIISEHNPTADYSVVSNPEFLREGAAISDFMHPDRVVLGVEDRSRELIKRVVPAY